MTELDVTKEYRADGQYCFMKQFELCENSGCPCDNQTFSDEAERFARIGALLTEEFEDIERGE